MKYFILGSLLLFNFASASNGIYRCSMTTQGTEMFFSVIDLMNKKALIGYWGEEISSANDEFELRLQKSSFLPGSNYKVYEFYAFAPQDYPGAMKLSFNSETLKQTAVFISEGTKMSFKGACKKL